MDNNGPLEDPFSDPALLDLLDIFFELLEARAFEQCRSLLEQAKTELTSQAGAFLLDYCASILHFDTRQWDEAERTLRALIQKNLHPRLRARVLNELSIVQEHFGHFGPALTAYSEALKILHDTATTENVDRLFKAKVLKNRAICTVSAYERGLASVNALRQARQDILLALETFQEFDEAGLEGRAWNQLGAAHKAEGRLQDAILCYKREQSICEQLEDRHGLAASLNNIGEALNGLGQYAEAESVLVQAVDLFTEEDDPYEAADASVNLGHALAGQGQDEKATILFAQAVSNVERLRDRMRAEAGRMDIFATQMNVYGASVVHALKQEDVAYAFEGVERARARGLLELISHGMIASPDQLTDQLLEREQILMAAIAQNQGSLAGLEQELADLYRQIRLHAPAYAGLKTAVPIDIASILARLPARTALLSYFAVDSSIIAFFLSPRTGVHAVEIPLAIQDLAAASFDAFGRVRSLTPGRSLLLSDPWLLDKIYAQLIEPLRPHFTGHRRLVFVPHGPLFLLPLHAAYNARTARYLIDEFDVLYAPSATLFVEHLQARKPKQGRTGCLAVAYARTGQLPHARREALHIAQQTGGKPLLDDDATPRAVLEAAPGHRSLHIAAHGRFSATAPLSSGVDLAGGRLTAWDLLNAPPLHLDLVTLSACDTALNYVAPGDELMGLLRALLYTGAPSVLLSLWQVEDLATRLFMQTFYQILSEREEEPKSAILRATVAVFRQITVGHVRHILSEDGLDEAEILAQLRRIPQIVADGSPDRWADDQILFDHPYFWASFLLFGEPSVMSEVG